MESSGRGRRPSYEGQDRLREPLRLVERETVPGVLNLVQTQAGVELAQVGSCVEGHDGLVADSPDLFAFSG